MSESMHLSPASGDREASAWKRKLDRAKKDLEALYAKHTSAFKTNNSSFIESIGAQIEYQEDLVRELYRSYTNYCIQHNLDYGK